MIKISEGILQFFSRGVINILLKHLPQQMQSHNGQKWIFVAHYSPLVKTLDPEIFKNGWFW